MFRPRFHSRPEQLRHRFPDWTVLNLSRRQLQQLTSAEKETWVEIRF